MSLFSIHRTATLFAFIVTVLHCQLLLIHAAHTLPQTPVSAEHSNIAKPMPNNALLTALFEPANEHAWEPRSRLRPIRCGLGSGVLHLRGGKLHPSLYPWLLSGHVKMDYYASLGVASDATQEEIRLAYKALVLSHHPDRKRQVGGEEGGSEANDRFIAVREAWEVLGDEDARRAYDLYVVEERDREAAQASAWTSPHTDSGPPQQSQSVSASFSFGNKNRYGFF
mmetsp:Transcript_6365/g.12877  ORF Transcript_6365/g.12877 Transcript_6365/m.12877 type:complete len:225 (+) Transcript_6365:121-795(+)